MSDLGGGQIGASARQRQPETAFQLTQNLAPHAGRMQLAQGLQRVCQGLDLVAQLTTTSGVHAQLTRMLERCSNLVGSH